MKKYNYQYIKGSLPIAKLLQLFLLIGLIYHDNLTPLVKIANVDSGDGEGGKSWGEKSQGR